VAASAPAGHTSRFSPVTSSCLATKSKGDKRLGGWRRPGRPGRSPETEACELQGEPSGGLPGDDGRARN